MKNEDTKAVDAIIYAISFVVPLFVYWVYLGISLSMPCNGLRLCFAYSLMNLLRSLIPTNFGELVLYVIIVLVYFLIVKFVYNFFKRNYFNKTK